MTALLEVDVRSRVLEVGAGSGYQTAVLAEVAGEVYAIERLAPLAERARALLARLGYANVHPAIGDGARGWHEQAPFDGILVAAAADEAPPDAAGPARRRRPAGRPASAAAAATRCSRSSSARATRSTQRHDTRCRFVPLVRDVSPDARRRDAVRGSGADAGRGLGAARRRGRPRRQHVSGGGDRHEVRRRQGQRRRAGRVLSGQRAPRGERCAACAAGCATRATAPSPCACRATPPPWTPCSTGAAWARRRRASRGSTVDRRSCRRDLARLRGEIDARPTRRTPAPLTLDDVRRDHEVQVFIARPTRTSACSATRSTARGTAASSPAPPRTCCCSSATRRARPSSPPSPATCTTSATASTGSTTASPRRSSPARAGAPRHAARRVRRGHVRHRQPRGGVRRGRQPAGRGGHPRRQVRTCTAAACGSSTRTPTTSTTASTWRPRGRTSPSTREAHTITLELDIDTEHHPGDAVLRDLPRRAW